MRLRVLELTIPFSMIFNTLRPRQNGHHFAGDIFKRTSLNEKIRTFIQISLQFVAMGPINNKSTLVQIMAWHRSGGQPLSEQMMMFFIASIGLNELKCLHPSLEDLVNILNQRVMSRIIFCIER